MKTNADHQRESRERRAAAYELVKRMAMELEYMKHERDTEGLEFFVRRVNEIVDDGELPLF
jgi:hypothetical protein